MSPRRPAGIGALALGALLLCGCGPLGAQQPDRIRAVVIADAASEGDAGRSWTDIVTREVGPDIDLDLDVDLVADGGWLTASPRSVADRIAAAGPVDLVIIALKGTDVGAAVPDDIVQAAVSDGFHAANGRQLVVLESLASPTNPALESVVQSSASASGATYVSLDLPPDEASPLSDVGQQIVARGVADALRDANDSRG